MHTGGMSRRRCGPKKTVYRVENWPEYEQAPQARGDVTLWLTPGALAAWTPRKRVGRGGQPKFSDLAGMTPTNESGTYASPTARNRAG